MDTLEAMKVFVAVADRQSYTRAASALRLPRATVSAAVQQLEAQVGARLLARTTRVVRLTRDGASFYERCLALLGDFGEIEGMFRQAPAQLRGAVRIDMTSRMARALVLPRLAAFQASHPQLTIELATSDRFVDLVGEGVDFVVRGGTVTAPGLVVRPLGVMSLVNVASPSYLAAHGTPRRLGDLADHRIINYDPSLRGVTPEWEYQLDGETHCVPMRSALTVSNIETYIDSCLAGLGLIQNPSYGLQEHLASGALVEVLPAHRAASMPLSIVYPSGQPLSRRVRVVMDWVAELVKGSLR